MQEETTLLTEAVVIGYGTQKKLSVTGSVTSASVKSLQSISTPFLSNTLGGSMSGIVTRQASGEPGNDASQIFIRGIGTWVNRNPLTLVDGVERDINIVNSQEIESITMNISAGNNLADPNFYKRVIVEKRVFESPKHYLWPIPQSEVDKCPNLGQNPKW